MHWCTRREDAATNSVSAEDLGDCGIHGRGHAPSARGKVAGITSLGHSRQVLGVG